MDTVFALFKKYDLKLDENVIYLVVWPNEVIRIIETLRADGDIMLHEWYSIEEAVFELKKLVK